MKHLKVSGTEVKPEHSCMMRNLAQCLKNLLWLDLILKKLIHRYEKSRKGVFIAPFRDLLFYQSGIA